jgi:hypothetical protein
MYFLCPDGTRCEPEKLVEMLCFMSDDYETVYEEGDENYVGAAELSQEKV